jgi:FKBP-type peptidyl-prolyl cis-trans isomerase
MTSGIQIEELQTGTGELAERGKWAVVRCRIFLNRGDEVELSDGGPVKFRIGARRVMAGLDKGITGMRVGGKRRLRISPHLAYGERGVPGKIPANAVIDCEVELIAVADTWRGMETCG